MADLSEEDRANLVAYLDGELDDAAAQELEAKINTEPQMRLEADTLKRTWELLDYLPKPEPSPTFTHRILERLALKQSHPLVRTQPMIRRRSWPRVLGWAAAVLLTLGAGRLAASWIFPPGPAPVDAPE